MVVHEPPPAGRRWNVTEASPEPPVAPAPAPSGTVGGRSAPGWPRGLLGATAPGPCGRGRARVLARGGGVVEGDGADGSFSVRGRRRPAAGVRRGVVGVELRPRAGRAVDARVRALVEVDVRDVGVGRGGGDRVR